MAATQKAKNHLRLGGCIEGRDVGVAGLTTSLRCADSGRLGHRIMRLILNASQGEGMSMRCDRRANNLWLVGDVEGCVGMDVDGIGGIRRFQIGAGREASAGEGYVGVAGTGMRNGM